MLVNWMVSNACMASMCYLLQCQDLIFTTSHATHAQLQHDNTISSICKQIPNGFILQNSSKQQNAWCTLLHHRYYIPYLYSIYG